MKRATDLHASRALDVFGLRIDENDGIFGSRNRLWIRVFKSVSVFMTGALRLN
jgi:hypothetical protein